MLVLKETNQLAQFHCCNMCGDQSPILDPLRPAYNYVRGRTWIIATSGWEKMRFMILQEKGSMLHHVNPIPDPRLPILNSCRFITKTSISKSDESINQRLIRKKTFVVTSTGIPFRYSNSCCECKNDSLGTKNWRLDQLYNTFQKEKVNWIVQKLYPVIG